MGCNHCVDPTCLSGCPVDAYTKDAGTGIVLHSADTCIGCQYCTWNCSYGVPQYNPERGVVGKCDMCHSRLERRAGAGVRRAPVRRAPSGSRSSTSTEWRAATAAARPTAGPARRRPQPVDDAHHAAGESAAQLRARSISSHVGPSEPHWPLVVMTVLTQLSVGAFATIWLLQLLGASTRLGVAALTSLLVGGLALGASTLHLGRPIHAYRALKMWKRSWLSREVLLFSAFAGVACLYAGALWLRLPGGIAARRADGAARPRRRDRQRVHLLRAVAAGLEHAVHARAVSSHGGHARAAASRRRSARESALARRLRGRRWPVRELVVLALRFFRLSASDDRRAAAPRHACSRRRLATHLLVRGVLLALGAIALPLFSLSTRSRSGSPSRSTLASESARTLSVLRQRRAQAHDRGLSRERGRMSCSSASSASTRGRDGTPTRSIR